MTEIEARVFRNPLPGVLIPTIDTDPEHRDREVRDLLRSMAGRPYWGEFLEYVEARHGMKEQIVRQTAQRRHVTPRTVRAHFERLRADLLEQATVHYLLVGPPEDKSLREEAERRVRMVLDLPQQEGLDADCFESYEAAKSGLAVEVDRILGHQR